jgi:hypothetical protein
MNGQQFSCLLLNDIGYHHFPAFIYKAELPSSQSCNLFPDRNTSLLIGWRSVLVIHGQFFAESIVVQGAWNTLFPFRRRGDIAVKLQSGWSGSSNISAKCEKLQSMREKQDEQQESKKEVKKIGFRPPGFYLNQAREKE